MAMSEVIADTHDRIKSWLTEEGLFKEELQSEGLYIQIMAEFPRGSGRHLSVLQPRDHEDMIVVFSRIVLADVHQKAFSALPQKKKEQLLWQMRYDLLFQESSFEIEPDWSGYAEHSFHEGDLLRRLDQEQANGGR